MQRTSLNFASTELLGKVRIRQQSAHDRCDRHSAHLVVIVIGEDWRRYACHRSSDMDSSAEKDAESGMLLAPWLRNDVRLVYLRLRIHRLRRHRRSAVTPWRRHRDCLTLYGHIKTAEQRTVIEK